MIIPALPVHTFEAFSPTVRTKKIENVHCVHQKRAHLKTLTSVEPRRISLDDDVIRISLLRWRLCCFLIVYQRFGVFHWPAVVGLLMRFQNETLFFSGTCTSYPSL